MTSGLSYGVVSDCPNAVGADARRLTGVPAAINPTTTATTTGSSRVSLQYHPISP